jgi:hypothetical protein
MGFMIWSEDFQKATYHNASLTMGDLRDFVAVQVRLAQRELSELILLHPEESRGNVVPPLKLYKLEDNHANNQTGWSFLKDLRNIETLSCGKNGSERWLLDRVIENEWIGDVFIKSIKHGRIRWRNKMVEQYLKDVD